MWSDHVIVLAPPFDDDLCFFQRVEYLAIKQFVAQTTSGTLIWRIANSIFYGPKLLTTPNPARDRDMRLLDKLGMTPMG